MRGTPFIKQSFPAGLNTQGSPYDVQETECRDCLNVNSTSNGAIRKRTGSAQLSKTKVPGGFQSLASVVISGVPYMIASSGAKLYSITNTGVIHEIGKGFTANAHWCVVQAPTTTVVGSQGPVYLMNGVDPPQYWTGATAETEVKEWTGAAGEAKLTDGKIVVAENTLESATAKFDENDVGRVIFFTTEIKARPNVREEVAKELWFTVHEATILSFISETKVELVLPENAFWAEAKENIHFELDREYYEDATSKKHVPNGKYMVFAGNRIWVTGIADDSSAVRFCGTAAVTEGGEQTDPSAWPKENLVRFDTADGTPITGIGPVGPYLALFKAHKTWIIHDLDTGENRKLADTLGCVSHRSIVESILGTFFLTADQGIYLTDGSKLHEMSYNVRPTIFKINSATLQNACGAYFNNHYYLSFSYEGSAVNNRTLDYDVILKSWWLHDIAPTQWCIFEASEGQISLCATQTGVGEGYTVEAFIPGLYTDIGKNYTGNGFLGAYWISNWEPFAYYVFRHRIKAPFLKKRCRAVFFDGSGEIIPFIYKNFSTGGEQVPGVVDNAPQSEPTFPIDFTRGATIFGNPDETQLFGGATYKGLEMIFGSAAETEAARIYSPGVARVFSVGFGNNSAEPFEVDSFAYFVQFRKS